MHVDSTTTDTGQARVATQQYHSDLTCSNLSCAPNPSTTEGHTNDILEASAHVHPDPNLAGDHTDNLGEITKVTLSWSCECGLLKWDA
eukprot:4494407-Amphidinium_carterae.2